MTSFPKLVFASGLIALVVTASPRGQALPLPADQAFDDADIPAHIAIVDGDATVERDGRADEAIENDALLAGDRLRTGRGRIEVMFADGSALDIDQQSDLDLLSDSLMRLRAGRVRLLMLRGPQAMEYRVDTSVGSVLIRVAGEYRIDLSEARTGLPELDVAALRGTAELQNASGRTLVRAGMHARATSNAEPSVPYAFNSAVLDVFDRWSEDQREARLGSSASRYLPADLRYYSGELDRSGSWGYEPTYGNVWYPRVDVGWRPYYAGRWSFVARLGWLWIGVDRWSWPTHHYGRWGVNQSRWFWIPDRRWSPAWVSWASAPGYVSWCPLGFDGRPVISIVDVSYRPGWTILPSRSFAPNVLVSRYVVDGRSLPSSVRGALVTRGAAPIASQIARTAQPLLRGPGASGQRGEAVPRGLTAPRYANPAARPLNGSADVGRSPIETARPVPTSPSRDDRQGTPAIRYRSPAALPLTPTESPGDRPRAVPRSEQSPGRYQTPPPTPARGGSDVRPSTPPGADRRSGRPGPQPEPARQPNGGADRREPAPPPARAAEPAREAPAPRQPERARPDRGDRAVAPAPRPARDSAPPAASDRTRPSTSADQGRAVPRGRGGL